MLSLMACRVSSLKAVWLAPWTKQPTLLALNVWHTFTQSSNVVGGCRLYLSKRSLLIQIVPAKVEPTETPTSLFFTVMLSTPIGASLVFQSLPRTLATDSVRSTALG